MTMMSIDILPTALPLDASRQFSREFYPYLRTLLQNIKSRGSSQEWNGGSGEDAKLTDALEEATIAAGGQLRRKHQWLQPAVDKWHQRQRGLGHVDNNVPVQSGGSGASRDAGLRKRKVLMLGSGMVAGPAVQEISRRKDVDLVIGE